MLKIKDKLIDITDALYARLFGRRMSERMRSFAVNMSWSFYSALIAMPLAMLVATVAGRLMGPEQFGYYNLVILVSSYLVILAFWGLDVSTVKEIAKTQDRRDRSSIFFSSAVFVVFALVLITLAYFIFGTQIASIIGVPLGVLSFALFYTYAASFKAIYDSLMRGLEDFRTQAIGRIVEAIVTALVFALLAFVLKKLNYEYYLVAVFSGALVIVIYYLSKARGYCAYFSYKKLKQMLSESKFFMLSALLATVFVSADRLLIAKFVDIKTLGIYSAYYLASLTVVITFARIISNVLLPATAKARDKKFVERMNLVALKSSPLVYIFIIVFMTAFLLIFGKEYPLKLSYLLLFALGATLYFYQSIYATVMLDAGKSRYAKYVYLSNVVNIVTVAGYYFVLRFLPVPIELVLVVFVINTSVKIAIQQLFLRAINEGGDQGSKKNLSLAELMYNLARRI